MVKVASITLAGLSLVVSQKHPDANIRRLNKLVQFGKDWVNTNIAEVASVRNGKWQQKFGINAGRMQDAYYRCGTGKEPEGNQRKRRQAELYEPDMSDLEFARSIERYNMANPMIGIQQITGGFRKWAQRYLGSCRGQTNNQYQKNRMNKWKNKLQ